jgi:lipid-A-disaccharide synthase
MSDTKEENTRKHLWLISGEESGDIYGAALINELKNICGKDNIKISAMGGKRIQKTGAEIMVDSTELGVVGLFEILEMIGTFIKIFRMLRARAAEERPDAVILIDYPGFNMRFAREMKKLSIPVIWYISPQVWAWKKKRKYKLAEYCAKMMVIFPFEVDVYKDTDLDTEFVGHPLVDVIRERTDPTITRDPNRVLLLPGSRKNEIYRLFEPMLDAALILHKEKPQLKFTVCAPREKVYDNLQKIYEKYKLKHKNEPFPEIEITLGQTAEWMQRAAAGLAASGTVTMECAIAGLPLAVGYKLQPLTFFLANAIVTLNYFTMVNIISQKLIFEEFLQEDVNGRILSDALKRILPGGERRKGVLVAMKEMTEELSAGSGNAANQAAKCVLKTVEKIKEKSDRK